VFDMITNRLTSSNRQKLVYMADQSKLLSQHVQPIHYLSQSWLVGRLLSLSVV
jgi:hypothetical protein